MDTGDGLDNTPTRALNGLYPLAQLMVLVSSSARRLWLSSTQKKAASNGCRHYPPGFMIINAPGKTIDAHRCKAYRNKIRNNEIVPGPFRHRRVLRAGVKNGLLWWRVQDQTSVNLRVLIVDLARFFQFNVHFFIVLKAV